MDRGYSFSAELLQMMLSEERQKFVSALDKGVSWKELNRIRVHIAQINHRLDSLNKANRGRDRYEEHGRG